MTVTAPGTPAPTTRSLLADWATAVDDDLNALDSADAALAARLVPLEEATGGTVAEAVAAEALERSTADSSLAVSIAAVADDLADHAALVPAASGVSFAPAGLVSATTVQAAIAEVSSEAVRRTIASDAAFSHSSTAFPRWFSTERVHGGTRKAFSFATDGQVIASLWAFTSDVELEALAVELTAGGLAGRTVRLAVYGVTSTSDLYPSALLGDSGDIDCAASGAKVWTPAQPLTLPAGLYWFAVTASNASLGLRGTDVWGTQIPFGAPTMSAVMGAAHTLASKLLVARTYGAFPATFPVLGDVTESTSANGYLFFYTLSA